MHNPWGVLVTTFALLTTISSPGALAQSDGLGVRHNSKITYGDEDGLLGGSVTRAQFTRAVVKSEPVDTLSAIPTTLKYLYYFTELKGFTGETIAHRWEHNGQVVAESRFDIGGPRWRSWSGQMLAEDMTGHWRVSVLDFVGRVIAVSEFDYGPTTTAQH